MYLRRSRRISRRRSRVVEYDLGKQLNLFRELGRRISELTSDSESSFPSGDGIEGLREWSRDVFSRETLITALKWLFGIWALVWGARRGILWWRFGRRPGLSRDVRRAHSGYQRLEKRARKEGITVPPSMTPEELLAALPEIETVVGVEAVSVEK